MLSTQHFDSPRNVAWCLLRQRTASKGASKQYWLRHAANQEVQSVNVITGEEVSNTDPQLTVLHLNPMNKRFCRRQIDPLHIYSIYDKKNLMYFPPVVPSAARVRFQNRGVGAQQKCCTPKSLNCWMPVTNLPTCYASIESWGLSGLNAIRITSVSAPERISWTI